MYTAEEKQGGDGGGRNMIERSQTSSQQHQSVSLCMETVLHSEPEEWFKTCKTKRNEGNIHCEAVSFIFIRSYVIQAPHNILTACVC